MSEQRGLPDGLSVEGSAEARRGPGLSPGKVALVALLVFLPGLAGGFVYDDLPLIRDNPQAHGLRHAARAFTSSFWELAGAARYYRPVVTLSYLVDWAVGGGRPWLFHLTNVALHAAATALSAVVALRWTGSRPVAIATALLFALHPSRTQSVTWISGRPDVLMTVFALASVELAHRAASAATGTNRLRLFALASAAFVGALLCKEAAAVLPLLVGVDLALSAGATRRRLGRYAAVTGAVALAYVAARLFLYPTHPGSGFQLTPLHGLMTTFAYAERIVLPWPQTFFHRPLAVEAGAVVYPSHLVAAGAVVATGFAALVGWASRRDRVAAGLLLSFAASIGPFLNFARTGLLYTTADHLLYLPLLLLFAGAGRLVATRATAWVDRRDVKLALAAVLLAWSGIVLVRSLDYRDQETLFESELDLLPDNPMARMSLGEEAARAGDVERAFQLSLGALDAGRRRYPHLLAPGPAAKTYQRLLGLQAARTADGSPHELELLLDEMERLLDRRSVGVMERVGELELGRPFDSLALEASLSNGGRQALAAEAAFVASRVGAAAAARRHLATLGPQDARHVPSLGNLVLAHARIGDFEGARRWLGALPDARDAEEQRLGAVQALLARAQTVPLPEAGILRAQAYLELGAFLLALRELHPAYDRSPNHPVAGPLQVHLLMAARLEQEAAGAAARALGAEAGRQMLDGIRAEMPPRLLGLRRPLEPSPWLTSGKAR